MEVQIKQVELRAKRAFFNVQKVAVCLSKNVMIEEKIDIISYHGTAYMKVKTNFWLFLA
jgi:hypothetical protein